MSTTFVASRNVPEENRRFMSVDALRGFDMLWIVGASGFVHAFHKLAGGDKSGTGLFHVLEQQLSHKEWDGFAFYDLIFPLFVFLVGVSIVFSLTKSLDEGGKGKAYGRIFRRFGVLYIIALIYSGGFSSEWPNIRLLGVLNRIALAYLFASILFLNLKKPKKIMAACAALLVGYWALMTFLPFPDLRPRDAQGQLVSEELTVEKVSELNWGTTNTIRGVFRPGVNLAHYVDQKYLPGKKWNGTWDPEGFLSTIPAIGTCLLGVLAGLLIQSPRWSDQHKVFWLFGVGACSVVAGFLWGMQFPVIKKIWSSSFVLVAGGYSAMLLGAFYQMVEIWGWKKPVTPFVWVGANSITIYLANNIIGFGNLAKRFAGGDVKRLLDTHIAEGAGDLLLATVTVGIGLLLVRFLYQRKIFLRV